MEWMSRDDPTPKAPPSQAKATYFSGKALCNGIGLAGNSEGWYVYGRNDTISCVEHNTTSAGEV
jgi:hypothetical protein